MNTQLKIINRINKHVALHYTYTKWIKKIDLEKQRLDGIYIFCIKYFN